MLARWELGVRFGSDIFAQGGVIIGLGCGGEVIGGDFRGS